MDAAQIVSELEHARRSAAPVRLVFKQATPLADETWLVDSIYEKLFVLVKNEQGSILPVMIEEIEAVSLEHRGGS